MEKVSFLQKCLAKLNLNEEGKIGLVVDKIKSSYDKQIKAYERKINDLKQTSSEKLVDLQEVRNELIAEKNEIFTTIEVDKIKTNEDRKNYVEIYSKKAVSALDAIKSQDKQIEKYKEQVENQIKEYQEQIDLFKELLNEMI